MCKKATLLVVVDLQDIIEKLFEEPCLEPHHLMLAGPETIDAARRKLCDKKRIPSTEPWRNAIGSMQCCVVYGSACYMLVSGHVTHMHMYTTVTTTHVLLASPSLRMVPVMLPRVHIAVSSVHAYRGKSSREGHPSTLKGCSTDFLSLLLMYLLHSAASWQTVGKQNE